MTMPTEILIRDGNPPTMELRGEIDFAHASRIIEAARKLTQMGQTDIRIDCADLEFIDSSGLSALLETSRMAKTTGGSVRLMALPECVDHILRMTCLAGLFEIERACQSTVPILSPPDQPLRYDTFAVSARPEMVSDVRRHVAQLAREMPFTDDEIEDIKLAVGEATSNAIRHGSPLGENNRVVIRCERMHDRLVVEVADEGDGFDPSSNVCVSSDQLSEGGRGLFFMNQLMDEVVVQCGPAAVVRLVKRIEGEDGTHGTN